MKLVLDAYALIAALVGEPAGREAEPLLGDGILCAPNAAEVLDVCVRVHGNPEDTVRERLEAHRADSVCASCHAIMDPIGFTLENFDLIGAWRDVEGGQAIDATAVLTDGTAVDGPAALRAALLDRSEAFVTTATERLMTYALGRRLEHYDMPAIRAIVSRADGDDYHFSSLVQGVVASDAFRMRVVGEVE